MQYEIDYTENGKSQTLYADLSPQQVTEIQDAINDTNATETILQITSRVKKDGPAYSWMFRASGLTLRQVQ